MFWWECRNRHAGRINNTWITYNPNKTGDLTGAALDLKYNTCKTLDIKQQIYGAAIINEYSDHIDLYMNNFDEDEPETLREDTVIISGASEKPEFTFKDRGMVQTPSEVTESWSEGKYTLMIKHNGPVDISVKCSGSETNRLTSYKKSNPTAPAFPAFYQGDRQYEGENFDMKNIEENITNGCRSDVTKFQGMGFLKFGTKANAAVKDTVRAPKAGTFKWTLRYSATSDVDTIDLYVNGEKATALSLPKGSNYSDWKTVTENITLRPGDNTIELKANAEAPCSVYLDNFRVSGDFGDGTEVIIEPINGKLISELMVNDSQNAKNWSIWNNEGAGSLIYGDRDITFATFPENLVGAETIRTACDSKLYADDLAVFTAAEDITVYVAVDDRVIETIKP